MGWRRSLGLTGGGLSLRSRLSRRHGNLSLVVGSFGVIKPDPCLMQHYVLIILNVLDYVIFLHFKIQK